ncbi:MAG: hypothetical protein ASARMPREDX12_000385 [Alectoria sarmentosa]|nr:MAG: hypothetical protein ASARMPREDX12_000385 [Alectoria sarmentosa]
MVGASSGIGAAMADRLVQEGSKVIAVGRRKDRLDDFVHKHGKDKASAAKFDITDRQNMDEFVRDITHTYPDLDCVFLNAGVQSLINLAQPAKVDLSAFHSEITTNFSCFVDLTVKFLPFLMNKKAETSLIYTGSNLAIVPASSIPAYSASKAALNAFVLCLRDQLRNSSVKVIEVSPPRVQTELHDYMGHGSGRKLGMPVDAFVDETYKGLASGSDQVIVGSVGPPDTFNEIVDKRRNAFQNLAKLVRGEH